MLKKFKEKIKKGFHRTSLWYGKYERPISSISLIGGFVFDALTLERIDRVWDNFWVLAHIILVGFFMILVHSGDKEEGDETNPVKRYFWYVNILQFFFGGLLSVFLVFYFRSSDLSVSWPFLFILALAFWANESLKKHFVRLTFQVSLFFLSLFSTAIFLVPVIAHQIGTVIFLISGLVSLLFMAVFLYLIHSVNKKVFNKSKRGIIFSISAIFIAMNIFYFTNLIPPIPLSLKDLGLYYSLDKNSDGSYSAKYEEPSFLSFIYVFHDFHVVRGTPIYAYSAIFSPSNLNPTIVHRWQYYNRGTSKWTDYGKVTLKLVGGRDEGFRTYSVRDDLFLGEWRISVETTSGQVIGRERFNVVQVDKLPPLKTRILN